MIEINPTTDLIIKYFKIANGARKHSYCPTSNFPVGVCIVHDVGISWGTNFEHRDYSKTVHAEVSALADMVKHGGRKINYVFVVTDNGVPPCQSCLDYISEFGTEDTMVFYSKVHFGLPVDLKVERLEDMNPDWFKKGQMSLLGE